jgi:8-oxo-dGTP pyrophosphatase MutT (NUDIX family)
MKNMYCNNCGGKGHVFKTCPDPITSCGILLLREIFEPMKLPNNPSLVSVLMVRRKDSMAYMEFIRGKYTLEDTQFIKRLISNMTMQEQKLISTEEFDTLWTKLWGQGKDTHSLEYENSKKQYEQLDRKAIVESVPSTYTEPEWGFPKGRRMKGESDLECGIREFWEETNIPRESYEVIPSLEFIEIFTGTNNVKYKHVYYVAILKSSKYINTNSKLTTMQRKEISAVSWKTLNECKNITRPHYIERKKLIAELEQKIQTFH